MANGEITKLSNEKNDIIAGNIEKIGELFPNVIVESENGKSIDFDMLKQELSHDIVEGNKERYQLTWPGKKEAIATASQRCNKTLRPVREKSVDFDNTKNIYIEGDNLEALKILQESYLNKIKFIYIDPPYNTGGDFVYNDNFYKKSKQELLDSGIIDEEGNVLISEIINTDSNGKFHSDWLTMMYSRLKLARNLLKDDGLIFISIDENEFVNLKKLCDEIFGEKNYVENFIWIKNATKNLSKTTSTNHEYIFCYAKNIAVIEEKQLFRKKKEGLDEVKNILSKSNELGETVEQCQNKLKAFYKEHPELKGISMYNNVEYNQEQKRFRVYTLDNISAPKSTGQAATYEILHPKTGKPCKTPSRGWGYTKSTMEELINKNMIEFYDDENHVPRIKRYLDTVETDVIKSVIEDNTDGKKELARLFGNCPFDNPKPTTLFKVFFNVTKDGDIILDFFSGSATIADALMQQNANDSKGRKYIMIQLPEVCDEKSEAFKMGYKNICDLGEDRIRRAGKKIKEETNVDIDYGFRVYKVDSSNYNEDINKAPGELDQSKLFDSITNLKIDRTPEDLLIGVILHNFQWTLDLKIEEKKVGDNNFFFVDDNALLACFDDKIDLNIIEEIAKYEPLKVVFKDSAFTDQDKINLSEKFKRFSPTTEILVL